MTIASTASGAAIATVVQKYKHQKAERIQQENHLAERQALQSHLETAHAQRENALKTFLDMAMAESETLQGKIAQMHEVLADDQLEKVSIFGELEGLAIEHQHLLHDLQEMAIAETTLTIQLAHLAAASQAEINQLTTASQTRIADLETTLAQKTEMATQMLTELESEATSTFNQFNEKVISQSNLIEQLYQQIEGLKTENATLTRKQIDRNISRIGASEPMGNALFSRQTIASVE
ncbi:MAG: hypothetical protein AAF703_04415 [Cyanobacteria bacterium P01_D01_bin.105]